jgi:geranylgeranyl diphosphate synthase type II
MIQAMESASPDDRKRLMELQGENGTNKVEEVLGIFKRSGVDEWAVELKNKYLDLALTHLDAIAVMNKRKEPLKDLAAFLVQRDH